MSRDKAVRALPKSRSRNLYTCYEKEWIKVDGGVGVDCLIDIESTEYRIHNNTSIFSVKRNFKILKKNKIYIRVY